MAKAKVCWDSTVFIAVLTGEERTADDLQGLNEAIDLVDRRQLTVITSSLVRSEVLWPNVRATGGNAIGKPGRARLARHRQELETPVDARGATENVPTVVVILDLENIMDGRGRRTVRGP